MPQINRIGDPTEPDEWTPFEKPNGKAAGCVEGVSQNHNHLRDLIRDFYILPPPVSPGVAIANYLSSELTLATSHIKGYNLADTKPRTPLFDFIVDLTAPGQPSASPAHPSEVAVVTSWAATPVTGVKASRMRGRNYIGPLRANTTSGNAPNKPNVDFLDTIRGASKQFAQAAEASTSYNFIIFSRIPPTRQSVVTRGFVDNAWDTQRRRGYRADSRLSWVV